MSHRIRSVLSALAVTAAVAGGGAAIASAATSGTASTAATGSSAAHAGAPARSPLAPGGLRNAPRGHVAGAGHNCPNMAG
jgi:hypothetical protein